MCFLILILSFWFLSFTLILGILFGFYYMYPYNVMTDFQLSNIATSPSKYGTVDRTHPSPLPTSDQTQKYHLCICKRLLWPPKVNFLDNFSTNRSTRVYKYATKTVWDWSSLVVQQLKEPALSLQWFRLLLWHGFDSGPGTSTCWECAKKKKKKKDCQGSVRITKIQC